MLTANRKDVKHALEILDVVQALLGPAQVAVIHCPGCQKENGETKGNRQRKPIYQPRLN